MKISIIYHSETGNTREMARLVERGCQRVEGVEARCMPIDSVEREWLKESGAVIFGCPTYEGSCSWQMKKFLDTPQGIDGKLGGVFVSQNWPGGGGGSFAEMTIIAALLVHGMLIYSGGVAAGAPFLHFGAVSTKKPGDNLYGERCLKLGESISRKALEIFGPGE